MKLFGDSVTKKILNFFPDLIFPHFQSLSPDVAIPLLRKVHNLRSLIDNPHFQESLYENVILSFPTLQTESPTYNFSIIEVTLALFHSLSSKFSEITGNLIGRPILRTFQPSEIKQFTKDEGKFKILSNRLELISSNASTFVEKQKAKKESLKSLGKLNEDQRLEVRKASDGIQTCNNCLHYCRIIVAENMTKEKTPKELSWLRRKRKNLSNPRKFQQQSKFHRPFSRYEKGDRQNRQFNRDNDRNPRRRSFSDRK